jgi:hypothetical protein
MEAHEVLATARSGSAPTTWTILPLRKDRVTWSAVRWALLAVVGLIFLIPVYLTTVPDNFEHGATGAIMTALLLLVLAFIAFGSAGVSIADVQRLRHADDYLLVLTPDDYVKAEPGGKVTHVPMEHVAYVTMRGVDTSQPVRDPYGDAYDRGLPGQRITSTLGIRLTGVSLRRKPKGPPSLAFLDTRTDTEVVVARDDSMGDLPSLEHLLNSYSDAKARSRTG